MTSTDFIINAKHIVADMSRYDAETIQPVWFGYVLGNMKAILAIIGMQTNDIYEVTYNLTKGEIYVDRYSKVSNQAVKEDEML